MPGEETAKPSQILAELEKKLKLRLGREVLAKIRTAAVAFQLVNEKEIRVNPVLVVEAVSESAAKDLEMIVPKLFADDGKVIEPHRSTIQGQHIRSLTDKPSNGDFSGPPPHYGRRGKIVVLGWRRDSVAATLVGSTHKKDLLNLPRGQSAVEAEGLVAALGLLSCRQLLAHLTQIGSTAPSKKPHIAVSCAIFREMTAPMAAMPPTLFCVKRLTDGLRIEFRQSELPVASATVVDIALTWLLDTEALSASGWIASWPGQRWAGGMALPAPAAPQLPPPAPAPAPAAPIPNGK